MGAILIQTTTSRYFTRALSCISYLCCVSGSLSQRFILAMPDWYRDWPQPLVTTENENTSVELNHGEGPALGPQPMTDVLLCGTLQVTAFVH